MSNAYFVSDEFRNVLAIIALELIFAMPGFKRRSRFRLRLFGGIVFCLATSTLYVHIHHVLAVNSDMRLVTAFSVLWYTGILALATLLTAFCFEVNPTELVWIALSSYAAQHIAYVVVIEGLFMGLFLNYMGTAIQMLVYVALAAIIDYAVFCVFYPNLRGRERLYVTHSPKTCLIFVVVLIVFLASTFLNQYNAVRDYTRLNILAVVSDFINCLFVLVIQFMSLRNSRISVEKETVVALLENEKKQYETFRSAVDYINIKCHDLKKEITAMVREGKLNEEYIEEITDQIAVYESFVNTGNETLDFLLTDQNLVCLQSGISLSVMADASGLAFMEKTDLYSLFGNMLDNAVEYIKTLSEPEKRYIRLLIRRVGNMTVIHQENLLETELVVEDNIPETTKADRNYHGFGVKSMERIVKKYGGSLRIDTQGGLFTLEIMIPEKRACSK